MLVTQLLPVAITPEKCSIFSKQLKNKILLLTKKGEINIGVVSYQSLQKTPCYAPVNITQNNFISF